MITLKWGWNDYKKSRVRLITVVDVCHTVTAVYSGLAIDVQRHLLYFTDEGQGQVGELKLKVNYTVDMTSRVVDSTAGSRPRSIAVDTVNRYRVVLTSFTAVVLKFSFKGCRPLQIASFIDGSITRKVIAYLALHIECEYLN